jgi:hypothetical protein
MRGRRNTSTHFSISPIGLYFANWGTPIVKLRLPTRLLESGIASQYCGESVSLREKCGKIILTFTSQEEAGEWVGAEGQLSSLISVRSELARGDLRVGSRDGLPPCRPPGRTRCWRN